MDTSLDPGVRRGPETRQDTALVWRRSRWLDRQRRRVTTGRRASRFSRRALLAIKRRKGEKERERECIVALRSRCESSPARAAVHAGAINRRRRARDGPVTSVTSALTSRTPSGRKGLWGANGTAVVAPSDDIFALPPTPCPRRTTMAEKCKVRERGGDGGELPPTAGLLVAGELPTWRRTADYGRTAAGIAPSQEWTTGMI